MAEAAFDVLITTDHNMRHQQNITGRRLAILVLPTTSWPQLQAHSAEIADIVGRLSPGELRELSWGDDPPVSRSG